VVFGARGYIYMGIIGLTLLTHLYTLNIEQGSSTSLL